MKTWGTVRAGAIAVAVVASVGLAAAPATAATEEEVASWITASTLEKLDVATADSGLAAALQASIAEALAAGIIAPAVAELAEEAVGDPDADLDAEVDEALDAEFEEQERAWDEVSAQWHETFDTIRAEFAECRDAAEGGSDLCAHQFRYDMRVNHVEAWLARHTAKLGDISALPAAEQEAALAKLERKEAHAAAQLERARVQFERKTGVAIGADEPEETTGPVEETTAESTEQGARGVDERGDKGQKPEKSGHGNKGGNGNKGGHGHGNGKSDR